MIIPIPSLETWRVSCSVSEIFLGHDFLEVYTSKYYVFMNGDYKRSGNSAFRFGNTDIKLRQIKHKMNKYYIHVHFPCYAICHS